MKKGKEGYERKNLLMVYPSLWENDQIYRQTVKPFVENLIALSE